MKLHANIARAISALALSFLCAHSHAITVAPDNADLRYTGRWNFDNPAQPWVAWQGSTIEIQFTGASSITADINPGNSHEYFRVVVDGVAADTVIRLEPGRTSVTLATGLSTHQSHRVTLMKETFYGTNTIFYGFDLPNGTMQSLPPRPALRIEFFGDSNMDGTSLYSEKDQAGNDPLSAESGSYYAFPATVTRMLGAEMNLQAVGGATLTGAGDNTVQNFIFSQDWYNQDPNYRSHFNPHVIVVNAGANDAGTLKGKRKTQKMKDRYKAVVSDLRSVYGEQPHIVLHNGYGWDLEEPANYTHELINEIGGNLSVLLYPWMWEQWHGSMVEHAGQARLLADHIASLGLGFSVQQPAEVFDGFGRNVDVANGSFEQVANTGFAAFGWRYVDDGVTRICNAAQAAHGNCYIRLLAGQQVHQGTDATGDFEPGGTDGNQGYVVRAMIRSTNGGANASAQISADYEGQALYNRANKQSQNFSVTGQWQDYTAYFTAPNGSWKTYISLKSNQGSIEFDNVRMSAQ
jgi:lysophospholipase L1-like esterase